MTTSKVKIIATPILASDLQPGDLFSTMEQEYWDQALFLNKSIGERVYIRTNTPSDMADDADAVVCKITMEWQDLPIS